MKSSLQGDPNTNYMQSGSMKNERDPLGEDIICGDHTSGSDKVGEPVKGGAQVPRPCRCAPSAAR